MENKVYELKIGIEKIQVYWVMDDVEMGLCIGVGWILVMKINGIKVGYLVFFYCFVYSLFY